MCAQGPVAQEWPASPAPRDASFNIDVHVDPGIPPPVTFGGYPGQPGFWNNLDANSTAALQLKKLDAVLDNSFASWSGQMAFAGTQGGIPAPCIELYEDFAGADDVTPLRLTITQLDAGDYVAVLYSYYPGVGTQVTLTSGASSSSSSVACPPTFPGLTLGASMALISFAVPAGGGSIGIDILGIGNEQAGVLNGLQLVRHFGVSGCGQQPVNSKGAVPAMVASGSASVAANNLTLHVALLPGPGQLPDGIGAILCFASDGPGGVFAQTCPAVGVRCIGPSVQRVWDPNALPGSGGVTTGSGNYNLPVDLSALAAAGLNVSPGATLHFQMMYRGFDVSAACGPITGGIARWTQSVSIVLVP